MEDFTKISLKGGILINNARNGNYLNQDSIKNVIKYIARENGNPKNDLICCGAMGATDFTDIDTTIRQFECVQLLHTRKGNFGRYIDHEVYSFSDEEETTILQNDIPVGEIAQKMALDFYNDGFQVYYGIHKSDDTEKHLHVHFAVNTVNFRTGKKRHENKGDTKRRQDRMNKMILSEIIDSMAVNRSPLL